MGEWATSYHASSVVAPQDSNPSVGVFCGDSFLPKKCANVAGCRIWWCCHFLWLDVFCPKIGLKDDDMISQFDMAHLFSGGSPQPPPISQKKYPGSSSAKLYIYIYYIKSCLLIPENGSKFRVHSSSSCMALCMPCAIKKNVPPPKRMAIYGKGWWELRAKSDLLVTDSSDYKQSQ